jgi:hypothetical protein
MLAYHLHPPTHDPIPPVARDYVWHSLPIQWHWEQVSFPLPCSANDLLSQLFRYFLVQRIAKVLHRTSPTFQHHGGLIIRRKSTRFGVYPDKVKRFPHGFNQFVGV